MTLILNFCWVISYYNGKSCGGFIRLARNSRKIVTSGHSRSKENLLRIGIVSSPHGTFYDWKNEGNITCTWKLCRFNAFQKKTFGSLSTLKPRPVVIVLKLYQGNWVRRRDIIKQSYLGWEQYKRKPSNGCAVCWALNDFFFISAILFFN